MPNDKDQPTPQPQPGQGDPPAQGNGEPRSDPITIEDFDKWLASQPPEVQSAYQTHTSGLRSALQSERDRAKQLEREKADRARAEKDAEAQRLEEQQKWEELAKQRQTELDELRAQVQELEPLSAQVERYMTALGSYLEAARDGVPTHIIELLDKMDPVDQLTYITEHADALIPQENNRGSGPPKTPRARERGDTLTEDERRKKAVSSRTFW